MAVSGTEVGVFVAGQIIGCLTNGSFSGQNEEIDVTCKDANGARAVLPGRQTGEITFEGFFDPAAGYGLEALLGVHKNRTRVLVKMYYDDGATNQLGVQAYAYLNSLEWTGPLNAGSTFSGTFTFDGEWTLLNT